MGSPLDSTFGFLLISLWIQTLLQGCGMLQAWLYFHWYPKDHWGIKTMVTALVLSETFQAVLLFQGTYLALIGDFGNIEALFLIRWRVIPVLGRFFDSYFNITSPRQDSAQVFATFLSAFIVQMYFGYCIYVLDKKNKIVPFIIVTFALVALGLGTAQSVLASPRLVSFKNLASTKPTTIAQAVTTILCDFTITAFLVRNLRKYKGPVQSTNSMLTGLMINAVNRGMLTSLCAALNLILFLALPGTFYFFIGLFTSGKLYMNSALATLNSRQHIVAVAYSSPSNKDWNSIQMDRVVSTRSGMENSQVRVIVNKQIETESDTKASTFVDGMI